jgi:hypothetical protein
MTQLVLPLHECAFEPLQDDADPTTTEAAAVESIVEPLQFAADPSSSGAALTETFYLCVWV